MRNPTPYDEQLLWDDGKYDIKQPARGSPSRPYSTSPTRIVPSQSYDGTTYSLTLRVKYVTVPGENICVLGSIPELGLWKEFKAFMVWTEGHIWETVKPIVTTTQMFRYKYALLDGENGKAQELLHWEKGIDRVIECPLLPEQPGSTASLKHVHMNDEYEKFRVLFSVFYPTETRQDQLMVQTEHPVEGVKIIELRKAPQSERWMYHKYGQDMQPW